MSISEPGPHYRNFFSHYKSGLIYLNHASVSPLPLATYGAMEKYLRERTFGSVENFEIWLQTVEETRKNIAALVHAERSDQITLTGNTSDGLSAVAEGFPWQAGDQILLNTIEFPANIQPFRALARKGVELVYLEPQDGKITPEMIEEAITPQTRMLSISAVQYLNGFKADLKTIGEICGARDIYFIVDGIQAVGAVPIHVIEYGIDALSSGGHKWLMSPAGTGFLYLSDPLAERLQPYKTGWQSVKDPWQLSNFEQDWKAVSSHLETGMLNTSGFIGMNESIKMLLNIGIQHIRKTILDTSGYAIGKLREQSRVQIFSPLQDSYRSGIVTFQFSDDTDPEELVTALRKKNISVSAREGMIRISIHFYNTRNEIDTALATLFNL
ncbi:MAG TPA: aminotransferase class V-fold PLP-dependent enzyme [Balneolaceae bacterium]|nr:aminotransferase class V-fold PLP-dependent enzyme [Balneolaceae bacterium]